MMKKDTICFVVVLIILIGAMFMNNLSQEDITGKITGVELTNPKKSRSGLTITYDIYLSGDITYKLCKGRQVTAIAKGVTSAVDQTKGLMEDGLLSLLGLPSIPDIFGVMSMVSEWIYDNTPKCLSDIGTKYCGKPFRGKYTYLVRKGSGSRWYTNWDYFYASEVFKASGFMCQEDQGCVFSAKKTSGGYTGETGSCW